MKSCASLAVAPGASGLPWAAWLLLVAISAGGTPAHGAGSLPTALGSWQGIIVYVPAELEVEIGIELYQTPEGTVAGAIEIPTKPIHFEPLTAIRLEGDRASWEFHRTTGTFLYEGRLSADGSEIRGSYHERGKVYPFSLTRREPTDPTVEPVVPPLHTLSASAEELKSRFNQDVGSVRLVLLLSPG